MFRSFTKSGRVAETFCGRSVARIVKRYAEAAGLDPTRYSAHSLRAGFVTEAVRRGAPDSEIMGTTLHETPAMIARYRREADPVARGASRRMGSLQRP
jgi:integrase